MDNQKLISIPELFKTTWGLYVPRMWKMLLLMLVSMVGMVGIMLVFFGIGFLLFLSAQTTSIYYFISALFFLVGILLVVLLSLPFQVALRLYLKEEYKDKNIKELFILGFSQTASYFWITFLRSIIICFGLILFIIPGLMFSIWFAFSEYTFIFEGKRGMSALKRSKELAKGYWWAIFGRMLPLFFISMIISSITRLGFIFNSLFMLPFTVIYVLVIYEDLKKIKDTIPPTSVV